MDWLKGMNDVVEHIEENLTRPISYESLSRIAGCSVYEFSRMFSFMTGISISEYIRRRRLSQAVFDIQNGGEKIIDVALKYCYESQSTFTRAFRDLHGATPLSVRKMSVSLKTYPPISFVLTIKGVNGMNFRIEKKGSFAIWPLCRIEKTETFELKPGESMLSTWNVTGYLEKQPRFWKTGDDYYSGAIWQVGAYDFATKDIKKMFAGARDFTPEEVTPEMIPAATWAVFSLNTPTGSQHYSDAYTRILTEWFPASQYKRNENVPVLDVYPDGDVNSKDYVWEIWMPVI